MKKSKPKTVTISIPIPVATREKILDFAAAYGVSLAVYVRWAIRDRLKAESGEVTKIVLPPKDTDSAQPQ